LSDVGTLTGRRIEARRRATAGQKENPMRFTFRIAGSAAGMLLGMLGTAAAAPHWNPSPVFKQSVCKDQKRDYVSSLEGWPDNSNWATWKTTCESTAADFLDGTNPAPHHFDAPTHCDFSKNFWGNVDGVWGHFAVSERCPFRVGPDCAISRLTGPGTACLPGAVAAILGIGGIRYIRRRRPDDRRGSWRAR
jgi:hypothetical protein